MLVAMACATCAAGAVAVVVGGVVVVEATMGSNIEDGPTILISPTAANCESGRLSVLLSLGGSVNDVKCTCTFMGWSTITPPLVSPRTKSGCAVGAANIKFVPCTA